MYRMWYVCSGVAADLCTVMLWSVSICFFMSCSSASVIVVLSIMYKMKGSAAGGMIAVG